MKSTNRQLEDEMMMREELGKKLQVQNQRQTKPANTLELVVKQVQKSRTMAEDTFYAKSYVKILFQS